MRGAAVRRHLLAVAHAIVADDAGNAQAIVGEHLGAAFGLRRPMRLDIAPGLDRRFVPPERQRENLATLIETLEALDRDESVDLVE